MFSVTLGGETKTVPFVTAKALRDLEAPMVILAKWEEAKKENEDRPLTPAQVDVVVRWFSDFMQGAFSPEEILEKYPADRLLLDVHVAVLTVQRAITEKLNHFPLRLAEEQGAASGQ